MITLARCIANFEKTHPEWGFILRTGKDTMTKGGKYMCHLMSPEYTFENMYKGEHQIAWGATPEQAFDNAVTLLKSGT